MTIGGVGSSYHKILPYQFAPVGAEQMLNWDASFAESHRQNVASVVGGECYRFYDPYPTPILNKKEGMARLIKRRREKIEVPQYRQAQAVGLSSDSKYKVYETPGGIVNVNTGTVQTLTAQFNIRFNHLPFFGAPLSDTDEIVKDIIKRCYTIGLDPFGSDFTAYTGVSLEVLQTDLIANGLTPKFSDVLAYRFHMRFWPVPKNKLIKNTQEDCDSFVDEVRGLMSKWKMTRLELAMALGCSEGSVEYFLYDPTRLSTAKVLLAKKLGYTIAGQDFYDWTDLPSPKMRFSLDRSLYEAIEMQRHALGWTKVKLCEEAGLSLKSLNTIYDHLKTEFDVDSSSFNLHRKLAAVCRVAKVKIVSLKTYAWLWVPASLNSGEYFKNVGRAIQSRRVQLRMAKGTAAKLMPKSTTSKQWEKIENGEVLEDETLLQKLEQAAQLFKVNYDFLDLLEEKALVVGGGAKEVGVLLKSQFALANMSRARLSKISGISLDEIKIVFSGRRRITRDSVRILCRVLKIELPDLSPQEQWLVTIDQVCSDTRLCIQSVLEDFNVSMDEYWRLRRGDFELDEGIVKLIERRIVPTHLTEKSLKKFSSKEKWAQELTALIDVSGRSQASLARYIGVSSRKLNGICKGEFFWDDPVVVEVLAPMFRHYNAVLRQLLLEYYTGDTGDFFHDTGMPENLVGDGRVFNYYEASTTKGWEKDLLRRAELIKQSLRKKTLSLADRDFLAMTGGQIGDLRRHSRDHFYYLFSIGDLYSVAFYLKLRSIDIKAFYESYRQWAKETFNWIPHPTRSLSKGIRGKHFKLRGDLQGLVAAVTELGP